MLEDAPHPQGIAFLWRLDLDDFGTKIGQDAAGKRPGKELAEFENAHPIKRACRYSRGGYHSFLSTLSRHQGRDSVRPAIDLLQCHEDAVAHTFVDGLAQVPFAGCVFYQKHFAGTNDT